MPHIALSDAVVRSAKPAEKAAVTLWDLIQPKFGLRITPAGSKSFIMLVGSGRRQVIGRYPDISLKDARLIAGRKLAEKVLGKHVPLRISVADALTSYLTTHCEPNLRPRTVKEIKRLITRHVIPHIGQKPIAEVTKADITDILDRMLPTPGEARQLFATIRAFFRWAVRRGHVQSSPCEQLQSPTRIVARERVLDAKELIKIVAHARAVGYPFGTIIQLLLFTGQRRGEIGGLRWEWIDEAERTITLPASATKNGRTHVLPFGAMAAEILRAIPRRTEYVFPAARDFRKGQTATVFSGWGKSKAKFDEECEITPWTLHDLRRTFATNLAALGVRMEVTEKLLNHTSGSFGGIVGVYQRHEFRQEMRSAVEAWERKLSELLQAR